MPLWMKLVELLWPAGAILLTMLVVLVMETLMKRLEWKRD